MARPDRDREREKQEAPKSRRAQRRAARKAEQREARAAREANQENWNRRLIIGSIVAVVLVAFGFIAFGWYQTQVRPLGKTVLRVGDTEISLAHLERRMELERQQNFIFSETSPNLLQLPDLVIDELEAQIVLLEGLSDLGLSVTDEDVAAEVRERGGLADEVEASIYAEELKNQVDDSPLNADEYELLLRTQIAQEKATDYFIYTGPQEEPQVRSQVIVVEDEEEAGEVLQRLRNGEDFVAVAEEVSANPQSIEYDWAPRGSGAVPEAVEDFLFEADEGELSDVIEAFGFFYIAALLEREDDRPLDEVQRQTVAERELDQWVRDLRQSYAEEGFVEKDFSEDDALRALDDIL